MTDMGFRHHAGVSLLKINVMAVDGVRAATSRLSLKRLDAHSDGADHQPPERQ